MLLNLAEPWLQFKTPVVRQLAFAIASPNIIGQIPPELTLQHQFELHSNELWQQYFLNYLPRLKHLDQYPYDLIAFISKLKSTRLGLRFEMLIWFWLLDDTYHPYQLLGHSIQQILGQKTLGELDFLVLNRESQQVEHWEIALKYYLSEHDLSLPYWYGLNRSDTLMRKLNHFTQKQFQFQHALGHQIERRFCVLKGQLYIAAAQTYITIPAWINHTRRIGTWGTNFPENSTYYYRLERHEWITANAKPSSQPPTWWTDGLYKHTQTEDYYMYRQAPLIQIT